MENLNIRTFGELDWHLFFLRLFFRDLYSYWYLIKKRKFRRLFRFFYTKFVVPTGEGSQRWLFHIGLEALIRRFSGRIPLPRFVEIETTTICNKRCIICEYTYWPKHEQVKRHMDFDEFRQLTDQIPVLRWANLTGEGSAFLNGDYFRMLKHLSQDRNTSVWLVDHLADITFDQLRADVIPYIDGIYVSMDGATKKTYESIKVGCNFDNVIDNLRSIIDYKRKNETPFPHISFRYIMLKDNIHEMPLFLDLLNSIAEPYEWGGSSSNVEFTGLLYFPEIEHHYVSEVPEDIINELIRRKGGIDFLFSHPEEERNPPAHKCTAWMEPYIMMRGYVLPCCSVLMSNRRPFLREYSFGNMFERQFEDIWNSKEFKAFRTLIVDPNAPVPKICVGCRAFRTQNRAERNGVWDMYESR